MCGGLSAGLPRYRPLSARLHVFVFVLVDICIDVCMCVSVSVRMYVCRVLGMYISLHVCMYAGLYVLCVSCVVCRCPASHSCIMRMYGFMIVCWCVTRVYVTVCTDVCIVVRICTTVIMYGLYCCVCPYASVHVDCVPLCICERTLCVCVVPCMCGDLYV